MTGIYVHMPFCRRKCLYCDFLSYPGLEPLIEPYADAVAKEAVARAGSVKGSVGSVYFGGGTPTLAPIGAIERALDAVRASFTLEDGAEISIEANPETLDFGKPAGLRRAGFNRLSLGFQSLDDAVLGFLGRGHSAERAVDAFMVARRAGFENISVDLIFGIPGQTMASWAGTLAQVVALSPEHISVYSLTLEEGTPLALLVADGSVEAPDEDLAAEMFEFAIDLLAGEGYEHYEISNFARPGRRCRHNLIYWEMGDYLGLGAGAHSKIGTERIENVAGVPEYIGATESGSGSASAVRESRRLGPDEELSEYLFLGLRKMDGVDVDEIRTRFGESALDRYAGEIGKLTSDGLLVEVGRKLRLTRRGVLLGNEVFHRFV